MLQNKDLYQRLVEFRIFVFAEFLFPDWSRRTRALTETKPYTRKDAKLFLNMAHLKIVSAYIDKKEGTEDIQGLPMEVISSPRALTLCLEHKEFIESLKNGSMDVNDAIRISKLSI